METKELKEILEKYMEMRDFFNEKDESKIISAMQEVAKLSHNNAIKEKWNNIDNGYPEKQTLYLCYGNPNNDGFHITINQYCGNKIWRLWESDKENKSTITHWMELPNPPEIKKEYNHIY